jgi:DNA-binding NtrC family response regulator
MNILIIDDEIELLDLVSDQISFLNLNCSVILASTVQEAEEKIKDCDVIISDINVPQKERLDLLLSKTNKPTYRITGYDDIKGDYVVKKPFKVSDVKNMLSDLEIQLKNKERT